MIWAYQAFKPKKGQKVFTALNHSPMGYSVAASVGAKFAALKKNVIAIIGDGSVAMNVQEFETIAHNKLPIKIFIMNNNGYGLIKGTLELFLEKNYVGVDPSSGLGIPDFKKIAYSYNIPYRQINNHTNIKNKFDVDIGLSTTGISGPSGGSDDKPVGLIYIAIATKNKKIVKKGDVVFIERNRKHKITAIGNEIAIRLAVSRADVEHVYPGESS